MVQQPEDLRSRRLVVKSDFRPSATWEHLSSFSPAKVGYMEKKAVSSPLAGYQRRFFVASGHYLRYFNNSECEEMLAVIDIRNVSFFVRGTRGFGLRLDSQQFLLRCGTERDRDEWMATLALMRKRSQEPPKEKRCQETQHWRESMFGPPAASGVLSKWSERTKKWKPRFCVASGHYLRYYRSDKVGAPFLGAIDLGEAFILDNRPQSNEFGLGRFRFKAVDPETKAAWIEKISEMQAVDPCASSAPVSETENEEESVGEDIEIDEYQVPAARRTDIPPPPLLTKAESTYTKCCLAICTMPQ